jgi:hypothetical protein
MTLLETGLNQVSKGPSAVKAWLEQNPDALQPEFVDSVKQYAIAAMQNGAPNAALAAHMLAGVVHLSNQNLPGVINSQINQAEVMFFVAETTEAYEQAHQSASSVASEALKRKYDVDAFWALGLAADSAYFASEVAASPAEKSHWLGVAVEELLRMEPLQSIKDAPGPLQRFASGLVAIYQTIVQQNEPVDEVKLCRLEALADRLIPMNFTFPDFDKTEHVAYHLAELSKRCGNVAAAEARLKAIYQAVKQDEWSDG